MPVGVLRALSELEEGCLQCIGQLGHAEITAPPFLGEAFACAGSECRQYTLS